jgi:hypothetical protein
MDGKTSLEVGPADSAVLILGLSAQDGGPGVTLITEYGITVSLPATQQVSSRLVSLASPS